MAGMAATTFISLIVVLPLAVLSAQPPVVKLQSIQEITVSQQGRGSFASTQSSRHATTASLPLRLDLWAQLSGMMTYGASSTGYVLHFAADDTFKADAWHAALQLEWSASAGVVQQPAQAVLRVDETNCGMQESATALFNQDCSALNTGADDTICYCNPVPCVLKSTVPAHQTSHRTALLAEGRNTTGDSTPLPLQMATQGTYVVRLTPRTTANMYYSASFSHSVYLINASVVLSAAQVPSAVSDTNVTSMDYFCAEQPAAEAGPVKAGACSKMGEPQCAVHSGGTDCSNCCKEVQDSCCTSCSMFRKQGEACFDAGRCPENNVTRSEFV